jgi:hypothetical protein
MVSTFLTSTFQRQIERLLPNTAGLYLDYGWTWGDYDVAGEIFHFAKPTYDFKIGSGESRRICSADSPWVDVGIFDIFSYHKKDSMCCSYSREEYGFRCSVQTKQLDEFKSIYKGKCDIWVDKKIEIRGYRTVHLSFLGR